MRFFEKQRVDLIGQTGVTLQKILLFFMILSALTMFSGGLLSFIICTIGFVGAVKRNPRMLAFYYSITIFFIFLFFFLSLASYATYYNNVYNQSSEYSEYSSSNVDSTSAPAEPRPPVSVAPTSVPQGFPHNLMRRVYSPSEAPGSSSSNVSSSSDSYYYEEWNTLAIAVTALEIFFYFLISYLKIKSLFLAYRMRKLILAVPILPVEVQAEDHSEQYPGEQFAYIPQPQEPQQQQPPQKKVDEETHYDAPAADSQQQSHFTQPGYMPFAPVPMHYPNGPAMVPPPMMYGQLPVYYSFAPAPAPVSPPTAPRDDKL